MLRRNELSIYKTNLLYLILAIVFIFLGGLTQNINLFFGILVTEILILVVPNVWFVKRENLSLKKTWRLNKVSFKNIILIILITLLTYPIAVFFQAIFVSIISLIKPLHPDGLPIEISQIPFLWSVLFVAIIPGICEEIVFRGTILRAYEKLGIKKAIIISAILFAMFHFALINFMGPLILGIVFGVMVYKTNSIYSSMIAHAFNNFIALVLNYFLMGNLDFVNSIESQNTNVDSFQIIISFAIFALFIYLLILIVKTLLNKLTPHEETSKDKIFEDQIIEDISSVKDSYIEERKKDKIMVYMPLVIVTVIFFIFNFLFILE